MKQYDYIIMPTCTNTPRTKEDIFDIFYYVAWYNILQYSFIIKHETLSINMLQQKTIWYNSMQCNTICYMIQTWSYMKLYYIGIIQYHTKQDDVKRNSISCYYSIENISHGNMVHPLPSSDPSRPWWGQTKAGQPCRSPSAHPPPTNTQLYILSFYLSV